MNLHRILHADQSMTKSEAKDKLRKACILVFEVEEQMNVNTSSIRLLGYNARSEIANFSNAIHNNKETDLSKLP